MNEVVIEKEFSQTPATVFSFLSEPLNLLKWWGPEGIKITEGSKLQFLETGPWGSVMTNSEGQNYKVTGEVLEIIPQKLIKFTWAWHDDEDKRGHESVVQFKVESIEGGGTRFSLIHKGLADEESAQNHMGGWTSSLKRFEALITATKLNV